MWALTRSVCSNQQEHIKELSAIVQNDVCTITKLTRGHAQMQVASCRALQRARSCLKHSAMQNLSTAAAQKTNRQEGQSATHPHALVWVEVHDRQGGVHNSGGALVQVACVCFRAASGVCGDALVLMLIKIYLLNPMSMRMRHLIKIYLLNPISVRMRHLSSSQGQDMRSSPSPAPSLKRMSTKKSHKFFSAPVSRLVAPRALNCCTLNSALN